MAALDSVMAAGKGELLSAGLQRGCICILPLPSSSAAAVSDLLQPPITRFVQNFRDCHQDRSLAGTGNKSYFT